MVEFREIHRETGIPCFRCRKRSGLDCAGRRSREATLCIVCLNKWVAKEKLEEELHMKQLNSQSQSSQSSTEGSSGGAV